MGFCYYSFGKKASGKEIISADRKSSRKPNLDLD